MQRAEISSIAHRRHPIAAPLSPQRVRALLGAVSTKPAARAADLGCGRGVWLITLLELQPELTGVGVDLTLPSDVDVVAQRSGVQSRVRWEQRDLTEWSDGAFDIVICVGASHAFGGLDGTLSAIRAQLRPGGQVVLGDGIWDQPPSAATLDALEAEPEEFPDLAGLVDRVNEHGFEPVAGHVSTLEEWDDYEWSWTGSLIDWALREAPDEQQRDEALGIARLHREQWLRGYRHELGFATLVLADLRAVG